jgi:hypothetical protein
MFALRAVNPHVTQIIQNKCIMDAFRENLQVFLLNPFLPI